LVRTQSLPYETFLIHLSKLKYMSFADHTVKTKPRLLTVSESCRNYPRITVSGGWMFDWGFSIDDPVALLSITPGIALIRIGGGSHWPDVSQYCQPGVAPKMLVREPPSYRLSPSLHDCPQIIITGAWLWNWGFNIDDRISLTKTGDRYILMEVIMPGSEWRQVLRKRKLEREAKFAAAMLKIHKALYPAAYQEQAPMTVRRQAPAVMPAAQAPPLHFEQVMEAVHKSNAGIAVRLSNEPVPVS
jgi:hypothetical protein